MKQIKLKSIIIEKVLRDGLEGEDEFKVTRQERDAFLESVRNFNKFRRAISRNGDLQETLSNLRGLIEYATKYTVHESGDWFDSVTVKRHMKSLQESYKLFEKTAQEMTQLQQRLENCFEDIGMTLNRYYEIKEEEESNSDEKIQNNMHSGDGR